ncbi:MAG TPA: hypothetical protein ENI29_11745 [bacterium]|nr:hypothetical protein [bacterium]
MGIKRKRVKFLILFLIISSVILPLSNIRSRNISSGAEIQKKIHSSAQRTGTKQWIKNPNFESPIEPWFWKNGTLGDNSDMDGTNSTRQANFRILGEKRTFSDITGFINSSSSKDWFNFTKSGYLTPSNQIDQYGIVVSHHWDETAGSGEGQIYNYPSIHFRKNISLNVDMSEYVIKTAYLDVDFNASVDSNIDTPNDNYTGENDEDLFAIGDFATFYVLISDINFTQSFTVAFNRTKYLGQSGAGLTSILNITTKLMTSVDEEDLITALNAALDKDPNHSDFSITLGIDIYSEDNDNSGDHDDWDSLRIRTCNFSFTYEKKIDSFTTVSWNQIGNKLNGSNFQITNASFNFKYKVNKTWLSSAPLSELKFYINNKSHSQGVFKLSAAPTSFQYATAGGFDITNLITTDVNISTSFEVFLKDSFELNETLMISITEVTLNISYIETFPDYDTDFRLFLNGVNKTSNPVFQLPLNNILNISFQYVNQSKNHITNATIQLEGEVTGTLGENVTFQQYEITINTTDLGIGISILTVVAQKSNYETQNVQIFVEVTQRITELQLYIEENLTTDKSTISAKFNEIINVSIYYQDNETKSYISGANVDLLGIGRLNETNNYYNITLNTTTLDKGVNIFTVYAQLDNYQPQSVQFFIEVFARETELVLKVNSSQKFDGDTIQVNFNEHINFAVYYNDSITKEHITGAGVSLLGINNLTEQISYYDLIINSSILDLGINIFTFYAQLDQYKSQSLQIFIEVFERETKLVLKVNSSQKFDGDTIKVNFDEHINITIYYKDNVTKEHITGAGVSLLGISNLTEQNLYYNIIIDSSIFDLGINVFSIYAQFDNYQPQSIQIFIEVFERETEVVLKVNNSQKFDGDTIKVNFNEFINITIYYRDNFTKKHITGASVSLFGIANLTEQISYYDIIINSNIFVLGINVLTIYAQLDGYKSQSIQIFVDVSERESELVLKVDNNHVFDSTTIQVNFNEFINITLYYKENFTKEHITGAGVSLLGITNLTEQTSYYEIIINSNIFVLGINVLTFYAQLDGYKSQSIQIFIDVNDVETDLLLYFNQKQVFDSDTVQVQLNEMINFSVYYKDNLIDAYINGASVSLFGIGNLTEQISYYNIIINSSVLDLGINFLTIYAQLDRYKSQSIQFFIEVFERTLNFNLFFNDENKTLDHVFDLPITSDLNITIELYDNRTGSHINEAVLQLIGEGLLTNFMENYAPQQYSLILNTSDLNVGIKLFSIIAQATDYQPITLDIRITIKRISTNINTITGESSLSAKSGQDFKLKLLINNTNFGGVIKGATVSFMWDFGLGELTDLDNDGVYEIILQNVKVGSHIITITAFTSGDLYEFETYTIVLNVIAESGVDLTWIVIGLAGGIMGLVSVFISYQKHFKYPPMVRKARKLRKNIRKGKKTKAISVISRYNTIKNNFQATLDILPLDLFKPKKIDTSLKSTILKNDEKTIKKGGGSSPT